MKYVKKGNLRDIDFQKIFIYNNGEIAFVNNLKDLEKDQSSNPIGNICCTIAIGRESFSKK